MRLTPGVVIASGPDVEGQRDAHPIAWGVGEYCGFAVLVYLVVRWIRFGGRAKDDRWRRRTLGPK